MYAPTDRNEAPEVDPIAAVVVEKGNHAGAQWVLHSRVVESGEWMGQGRAVGMKERIKTRGAQGEPSRLTILSSGMSRSSPTLT